MCLRIIETQGESFDVTCRTVGLRLGETAAAIPYFANDGNAVVFRPGSGIGERMQAARYMSFPGAKAEIEIMLPISLRAGMLGAGWGSGLR